LDYRHVTQSQPIPSAGKSGGRKPQGQRALSGAERQAHYRQRQAMNRPVAPPLRRRSARHPSRPQRWRTAVAELLALQAEYARWLDRLPEALCDGATGEALQAIADLDLDELASIKPPLGFGRD
jgi:hypothetical protein